MTLWVVRLAELVQESYHVISLTTLVESRPQEEFVSLSGTDCLLAQAITHVVQ